MVRTEFHGFPIPDTILRNVEFRRRGFTLHDLIIARLLTQPKANAHREKPALQIQIPQPNAACPRSSTQDFNTAIQ